MKKLTSTAVAMLIGVVAQAATFDWTIKSDWVSQDGENPLSGAVYAFDALANSSSSVMSALTGGNMSILSSAVANGTVDGDGAFWFNGNGGLTDDGGSPAKASVYMLILDSTTPSSATGAFVSDAIEVKLTDAVLAGGAFFAWDEINVASFTPIPEPTSGLLVFFGLAGLALKRKRV